MTIKKALQMVADAARLDRRKPPVIETDVATARLLIEAVAEEIGCSMTDLGFGWIDGGVSGMFDGVTIRGKI